jgi:hypothetical protein
MGRRAWTLLERRLRAARHLGQHLQRFDHRLLANVIASHCTEPAFLVSDAAVARRDSQMHKPDGFARRCTAWTCNPGDRNREIDIGMFQCAECHCGRGFLAHCAEGFQRGSLDAKHSMFGIVRIRDEAAIDHIGRAGNFSQRSGNEAAGARLRRRNGQLAHPAQIQQRAGEGTDGAGGHADGPVVRVSSQGRRMVAAAVAAIPS